MQHSVSAGVRGHRVRSSRAERLLALHRAASPRCHSSSPGRPTVAPVPWLSRSSLALPSPLLRSLPWPVLLTCCAHASPATWLPHRAAASLPHPTVPLSSQRSTAGRLTRGRTCLCCTLALPRRLCVCHVRAAPPSRPCRAIICACTRRRCRGSATSDSQGELSGARKPVRPRPQGS